jgi:hypothetical protein
MLEAALCTASFFLPRQHPQRVLQRVFLRFSCCFWHLRPKNLLEQLTFLMGFLWAYPLSPRERSRVRVGRSNTWIPAFAGMTRQWGRE